MGSRYDAVLAAIIGGRQLTKDMITLNPADSSIEFPLTDKPNQAAIDTEATATPRTSTEQKRKGGE